MSSLDCTDHRGGAPARNPNLTRVTDGKTLFGFFRKMAQGRVKVIACHEGRLHIIGECDEEFAQKILILALHKLARDSADETH